MWRHQGVLALVLSMVAIVGCTGRSAAGAAAPGSSSAAPRGGAAASTPSVENLTVKGTDQLTFQPSSLTARANTPLRITLDDSGDALVHDFVIDYDGGKEFKVEAQPNGKATGDVTLPAGTYQFYCSQPGHKEAGMVGTLVVS